VAHAFTSRKDDSLTGTLFDFEHHFNFLTLYYVVSPHWILLRSLSYPRKVDDHCIVDGHGE